MTNPKESAEEKPSSSERQPQEKNSPQNPPGAQERTEKNESNVTQSEKGDEGDNVSGDQEKTGQNKTKATQNDGGTETEGSGGDNVRGQGDGDIQKGTPADLENEKNVTQTEKGQESGVSSGGSSASISARKRGRNGDPIHVGSSSGSGSKARMKGEMEIPSCAPACYVCKRTFASWKAVFGHLRSHRRQTPGAFPPPTFTPEGSPERNNKGGKALKEQLAPALLNLARGAIQKMSQDSNTTVAAEVTSSSRRDLDIDLNEPITSFLLDLNNPPPTEKDDDDDDKI
ncbi:uncharacterized protein LOC111293309 [Durio zibethinus]|uniref:Uncharacterized protein LOC111293309 n=1 Tax=Durio zibethinus TaxID=66656 RepID=A0A6P5YMS2_DURZI|nr:uncharacterized protein LOC111293309 [Durio zibethinus]